jgi:hypothetical protein
MPLHIIMLGQADGADELSSATKHDDSSAKTSMLQSRDLYRAAVATSESAQGFDWVQLSCRDSIVRVGMLRLIGGMPLQQRTISIVSDYGRATLSLPNHSCQLNTAQSRLQTVISDQPNLCARKARA